MDQALGTYRLPGFSIIYGLENTVDNHKSFISLTPHAERDFVLTRGLFIDKNFESPVGCFSMNFKR